MRTAWDVKIPDWQNMTPWEQERQYGPDGSYFHFIPWQSKIKPSDEGNIYPHAEQFVKNQFALGRYIHAYTSKQAWESGLVFTIPKNHVWLFSSCRKERPTIEHALQCIRYTGCAGRMMLLPLEEEYLSPWQQKQRSVK